MHESKRRRLQLIESALSAHSFNFCISNLSPGTHTIHTQWSIVGGQNGGATCVGPGTVTVTQVKNFSFNFTARVLSNTANFSPLGVGAQVGADPFLDHRSNTGNGRAANHLRHPMFARLSEPKR
jgi:hypothetical protein